MILQWIFNIIALYLLCGLVFAFAFVFRGLGLIDEGAKDSSFGFKLIIIPGTTVFWPILFNKWLKAKKMIHHD